MAAPGGDFVNDQPSQRPRKPAPLLADYPHRTTDTIRYADLDPQGHVNNAVFATYFETGRVAMFRNPDLGIGVPDGTFILVRAEIDFMRELRWPGTVEIGTALAEFGRSSFTVTQVIFNDDACAARGRFTMVLVDKITRRSRSLTEDVIARLSQWKYRGK
jgi:acyl-CoA thioester hydrolase